MKLSIYGQTVCVDGVQLTSAVDRKAEARLLAEQVPTDAVEAFVYGPALGDVIAVLLERPQLKRLHVAIMSASLTAALGSEWRADPRVVVHEPGEIDRVFGPFVVSPAELRFCDEAALPLRDRLIAALGIAFNEFLFATMAEQWRKQEAANVELHDQHVSALFEAEMIDAIVIAGGPTTAQFYDRIHAQAPTHNIVVASTALKPLLAAGITPDVVVAIDRMPVMRRHFEGVCCSSRLVYNIGVPSEIPAQWAGPRYVMCEGDLFCGGSVVHAQVDLAVRMGAHKVHLFGVDLCFPGNRSHVDGATLSFDVGANGLRTVNGKGEWMPTGEDMAQYRRTLEDYIERHPEVQFVKHGRDGVPLKGARWGTVIVRDALGEPIMEVAA